jgi:hypothetical protein
MRNLNERLRRGFSDTEAGDTRSNAEQEKEADVVSIEDRQRSKAGRASLVSPRELENLRSRWTSVQASFIDDPRAAVKDADELISVAIKQLSETLHDQRSQLETQWSSGSQVSTEDLRRSLQQYRAFFDDRLLSI